MNKSDGCTFFPDKWINWKFQIIDIHDLCVAHDDIDDPRGGCASKRFAKGLYKRKVFGATMIFIVASLACWIKYPKSMIKRL